MVDTRSHFLPVRQRAQEFSGRRVSVEPMTHRRESVQVIERRRQGSVGKISHFFEALHEGRKSSTEDTDSGDTLREESCSPDGVGTEVVAADHQSSDHNIPCDDTAVQSIDEGLPEEEMFGMKNGVELGLTCNETVLEEDHQLTANTDCSSEDISSCLQVQSPLKWTSAATCSSQSLSASHSTAASCDSQLPTHPSHEQVEHSSQFFVQGSPPPSLDHSPDISHPKAEDRDIERLPCGHYTGDVHRASTQQVEDGFHGDTSVAHLLWTKDLDKSVSVVDSLQPSNEMLVSTHTVPECAVVGVQSQESASMTEECDFGILDAQSISAVTSPTEHDREELELVSAQATNNMANDELHQLSSLTSHAIEDGIEPSGTNEACTPVNYTECGQQVIHDQTRGVNNQRGEVKPDETQTAETTMNSVQTEDTRIEALKTSDDCSDEVQWDAVPTSAVQTDSMQTVNVLMKGQRVDSGSTVLPVTVQVQEPETIQLSTVSAHSIGEATEEASHVYEATSVVALPQKHRESLCTIDIEFDDAPPNEEVSDTVTSEHACENVNSTMDTGSAADSDDKTGVDRSLPSSDGFQSSLPLPVSLEEVDLEQGPCYSEQSHVTGASTKSLPADAPTPILSGTDLPPVLITRQKEDEAFDDMHLVKDDSVTDTVPLNVGDCDGEGVKEQQMTPVEHTVQETVLDVPQTSLEPEMRSEDVIDDQLAAADESIHAPIAKHALDSQVQAVREASIEHTSQNLQQSPVHGWSPLSPPAADVVSGPLPCDSLTLNSSELPSQLTSPYSSNYISVYNGDPQRWVQSETWAGSKQNERRQDHYLAHGQSSYQIQSPYPPLPFRPTMRDQRPPSLHSSWGGKHLPTQTHYQQQEVRHTQHRPAFGPFHHFQPPQRTIPAAYGGGWAYSDHPEWHAPHYSSDIHLYSVHTQRTVPRSPDTIGTGARPVLSKADSGQVEDGASQHYSGIVSPGKQLWGISGGREHSSGHGQEWRTTLSEGELAQAPSTGDASQPCLHGESTCEVPLIDRTQPCLSVWGDTRNVAVGGSQYDMQAVTVSVEGKTGRSTSTPTASLEEGSSNSLHMPSTPSSGSMHEGRVWWPAGGATKALWPPVHGLSGMASAGPALQECRVEIGSNERLHDDYFQRRSDCPEVALQLETSVWDEGEENGMLLSPANQTPPSPAKMTPRRPKRHKSAANGGKQDKRQGVLSSTDSTSRLPLFHTPRGGGMSSRTKLLLLLLFVLVVVFMGLQMFVGHIGWMPSL